MIRANKRHMQKSKNLFKVGIAHQKLGRAWYFIKIAYGASLHNMTN
jgi:hypothetical protein